MFTFQPGNFTGWGSEGVNCLLTCLFTYLHAYLFAFLLTYLDLTGYRDSHIGFREPLSRPRCHTGLNFIFLFLARSIFAYILILVNMPDPIRKRFHYGLLWPLRPACSRNRAGSYMPDPTSGIHFSSVFPKKAWSGFGQRHLVWKLAGVQESSDSVSGRTQPACY